MNPVNTKKKKRFFHVANTVLTFLLFAASGLSIYIASQSEHGSLDMILGAVNCVMGLILLIRGVFLPPKEKEVYVSGRFMKVLCFITFLGSGHLQSPSLMHGKHLFRSWDVSGTITMSTLVLIIQIFASVYTYVNKVSLAGHICIIVVWLLLDICSGFWTYFDAVDTGFQERCGLSPKECGKKALRNMWKTVLILFMLFLGATLVSFVMNKDLIRSAINTQKINEDIHHAQEKFDQKDPDGILEAVIFENVDEAILSLKNTYSGNGYYYILQYHGDNELNILTWTEESDQIRVDTFECSADGSLEKKQSFISSNITKADVEGKQDGIINHALDSKQ